MSDKSPYDKFREMQDEILTLLNEMQVHYASYLAAFEQHPDLTAYKEKDQRRANLNKGLEELDIVGVIARDPKMYDEAGFEKGDICKIVGIGLDFYDVKYNENDDECTVPKDAIRIYNVG